MKTPAPPPDYEELQRGFMASPANFARVVTTPGDRTYMPWDSLRYHAPPDGLTLEEWWFTTRFSRKLLERPLPLLDEDEQPFTYALTDRVLQSVEMINRNASGSIGISEQVTNPATRDRYIINSLIEEAITSSQLEGASTTRKVAKEMIRQGRAPTTRSERMILNNYLAMQRVTELRGSDLTPDLVLELHRIVTDGTLDDPSAAGRLQRPGEERVAVRAEDDELLHRPPRAEELPSRLERLCDFANGASADPWIPPVVRSIAIHFMIGYDHYFEDGNGRTARVLFYWSMLRHGYWLTEFLTISRILKAAPSRYARSFLLVEQDQGDLTHFLYHHLDVLERSIKELHEYLAMKARELEEIQRGILAVPGVFNHRQLAVLEYALKNPGAVFTAQSHSQSHRVSDETARQDLSDLANKGLLVAFKISRRFAWHPPADLTRRLSVD